MNKTTAEPNMPVTIYTPKGKNVEEKSGIFSTAKAMTEELISARELIWRLFLRDFSAKYRQTALGFLWALLLPLVTVGMFIGMNRSGILKIENVDIPYPLYAIIGISIWNLFSTGITVCTNSMINAGSMIVKINFPKVALVIGASGQAVVDFIIRILLIAAAFIYFEISPDLTGLILGIFCLIPTLLIMLGIGFVLSLVAGVLRDIVNMLNMVLMGMMLLTPVLYPITGEGLIARINIYNPFNYLVNVPRDLIIKGGTDSSFEFLLTTFFSLAVFYVGWKVFYLAQTKIAERI